MSDATPVDGPSGRPAPSRRGVWGAAVIATLAAVTAAVDGSELPRVSGGLDPSSTADQVGWSGLPQIVRGRASVVRGTAGGPTLARYAALADRAARRVTEEVPDGWFSPMAGGQQTALLTPLDPPHPGALLEVWAPATGAEFARLTRRPRDTAMDQVAAVADQGRVVVNPEAFARLTDQGHEFVLTHEAVHVALRQRVGGVRPMWLEEGFAEWVAAAGSGLPVTRLIPEALAAARAGEVPSNLPAATDFDERQSMISLAYQRSWLLVAMLVEDYGGLAMRRFLISATVSTTRQSDAERAADDAFATLLGTTRAEVTRAWVARLQDLALR